MEEDSSGPPNPVLAANMKRLMAGRSIDFVRRAMADAGVAIGAGSLHRALKGEAGSRLETLKKIASFFDVSPDQLLQPNLGHDLDVAAAPRASYMPSSVAGLPVVGTAKLGDDGHFYELEHPVGHGDGYIDWPSRDQNAYALRCKGDSMKPRIRHGEFVVVEPNHPVAPGDEVLVKAKDGRVMVKVLAYIRDGMVYLESVNEAHPKLSIAQPDIAVMHYVAGIAKSALWHVEAAVRPSASAEEERILEQAHALPNPPARKPRRTAQDRTEHAPAVSTKRKS
jgi:phage repressor protein C with HTH and peptisase S24 domain